MLIHKSVGSGRAQATRPSKVIKRPAILAILLAFLAIALAVLGTASSASADVRHPMPKSMTLFVDRDVWMPVSALVGGSGPYQNVTFKSSNTHVVTSGGYSQDDAGNWLDVGLSPLATGTATVTFTVATQGQTLTKTLQITTNPEPGLSFNLPTSTTLNLGESATFNLAVGVQRHYPYNQINESLYRVTATNSNPDTASQDLVQAPATADKPSRSLTVTGLNAGTTTVAVKAAVRPCGGYIFCLDRPVTKTMKVTVVDPAVVAANQAFVDKVTTRNPTFYPIVKDGYKDTTVAHAPYAYDRLAGAVYNASGKKVRDLTANWNNDIVWNGKNSLGAVQPTGKYRIVLTARNGASIPVKTTRSAVITTDYVTKRITHGRQGTLTTTRATSKSCYIHNLGQGILMLDCWGGKYAKVTWRFHIPANATNVRNALFEPDGFSTSGQGKDVISGKRVNATTYVITEKATNWKTTYTDWAQVSYTAPVKR